MRPSSLAQPFWWMTCLLQGLCALAAEPLLPQPVYRWQEAGKERLISPEQYEFPQKKQALSGVAFQAILAPHWLPGLIPVFAVERRGRFELRRHPPRGQENITEAFFLALPPADEPEALLVAGQWQCEATRASGSTAFPDFELASHREKLTGRFDPSSEYRFASLTGGTLDSHQIQLTVEYNSDQYELTGVICSNSADSADSAPAIRSATITGHWRQLTGMESGSWKAWRESALFQVPNPEALTALYEWRSVSGDSRQYRVEGETLDSHWIRAPQPLCRVWKP